MINNFEQIKKLLSFKSEDEFYFVQILQRKKDNPGNINGSNNSSRLIKAYYINSLEKLERYQEEMITLANLFNARVGINLNKRSYYKTAFNTLKKISEQMHNKEFSQIYKAWNTSCGVHNGLEDKIWILDVDNLDPKSDLFQMSDNPEGRRYNYLKNFINKQQPLNLFDTREFVKEFPDIEIHKNNPTNMYIP